VTQSSHLPTRCHLLAGPLGFFDGMRTKIVQTVLAAAIMFYIREKAYTATRAVSALLLSPAVMLC